MIYDNRPPTSTVVASFVGGPADFWREADVTSAVLAKAGQIMSLAADCTGDGLGFCSRERALDKPELVVRYE